MTPSPVFDHPVEPSPRDVLSRARAQRSVALKAARDLLAGTEHRAGEHDRWRANIKRHQQAIEEFDAAIAALPA